MEDEMIVQYNCYTEGKAIQHSFNVSKDATWCELLEEFNNFLGAVGYAVPAELHELEEMHR